MATKDDADARLQQQVTLVNSFCPLVDYVRRVKIDVCHARMHGDHL